MKPSESTSRHKALGACLALCFVCLAGSAASQTGPASNAGEGVGGAMSNLLDRARAQDAASRAWYQLQKGDKQALPTLVRLAKEGNSQAQLYVGYLLDNGEHFAKNSRSAAAYFAAAAPTQPLARYNLGLLYLLGRGVPEDQQKAVQLFRDCHKDSNFELAAVRLAQHYLRAKNSGEAWRYGEAAANMGNSFGFFTLGVISVERRDFRTAASWLSKAAQAGDTNAPRHLSHLYRTSGFPEASPVIAGMWQIIDDVVNSRTASAGAAGVSGLTDDDLAKSRSLAQDWLSNYGRAQSLPYSKTVYEPPSRLR